MIFVYIFYKDLIQIEIQKNSNNRILPFIRTKSNLINLKNNLIKNSDKIILDFLNLLNQKFPPFYIDMNNYLSIELLNIIKKSNFAFFRLREYSSLKRINDYNSHINKIQRIDLIINPIGLEIHINSFYKSHVKVSILLKYNEIPNLVPIEYNFVIPIINKKALAYNNKDIVKKFKKILLQYLNEDIVNEMPIAYDTLKKISKLDAITIKYLSNSDKKLKNINFLSNTLQKINIFNKESINKENIDYYSLILENYLLDKKYVEYNDNVIIIDKNVIEQIDKKTIQDIIINNQNNNIGNFFNKLSNIKSLVSSNEILNSLNKSNFHSELKDYQIIGVKWILNLYKNKIKGCLLADEMGLGKTVQAIAFLEIINPEKILIIAPASVVFNWKNEIKKFTKTLESNVTLLFNENKKITILSYEMARNKIEKLSKIKFNIVILDESQKIKNQNTQIFNAVNLLKKDFIIIMTGTPIENSLSDLWSMLCSINPNLFEIFTNKIKHLLSDSESYKKAIDLTAKLFSPIIIQRKREDVLKLPDKKINTILIDFSTEEEENYKHIIQIFNSAIATSLSGKLQYIALEGILRLRQYCSLHSIAPNKLLINKNTKDIKLEKALELIENILNRNEKVVIFSQFISTLNKLEELFIKNKYTYLKLVGSTSKNNREKAINLFQNKEQFKIFLISLKAGGIGINLTSATNAILFEPWWNPAIEEQAFSRIYRIGQTNVCNFYRLIYKNSIETNIDKLIEFKKDIFNNMSNNLKLIKNVKIELAKEIFNSLSYDNDKS